MTKRFTWIIALAAVACSGNPGLVLQPGETLRLDTDWELSRAGSKEIYVASVPSTVAGVLEEAGYFGDDLLVGRNYAEVDKTIFDDTWIYKTQFVAPRARIPTSSSTDWTTGPTSSSTGNRSLRPTPPSVRSASMSMMSLPC